MMNLERRIARLESRVDRLIADLAAGRRRVEDLTLAELEAVAVRGCSPAELAWLRSLSDADLQRVADGVLTYPGGGGG